MSGLFRALPYEARTRLRAASASADRAEPGTPTESLDLLGELVDLRAALPSQGNEPAPLGGLFATVAAIAREDPSAGLVLAMHYIHTRRLPQEGRSETERAYAAAVGRGEAGLLGGFASEARSGSPRRGAPISTTATDVAGGWRIDGVKSYCTGSSALTHAVVTLRLAGGEPATGLVDLRQPGVTVRPQWDVLGMRGSASNDVVFEGARVPQDAVRPVIRRVDEDEPSWAVLLAAVYLGIAADARSLLLPGGELARPVEARHAIDVPRLRQYAGEVELAWRTVTALVVAGLGENAEELGDGGALKLLVHREATRIVDLVGRALGARSLSSSSRWNQLFRDLRVGWHNAPGESDVIDDLGRRLLRPDR